LKEQKGKLNEMTKPIKKELNSVSKKQNIRNNNKRKRKKKKVFLTKDVSRNCNIKTLCRM
jgi:hypothetical protein